MNLRLFYLVNFDILSYNSEKEKSEEAEIDKSVIAHRLKEDLLEQAGRLRRQVADLYEPVDVASIKHLRCKDHQLSITCLTVSYDCRLLFTASKDSTIVKWMLTDMKKVGVLKRLDKKVSADIKGHKTAVQSLCISTDGKFLASGDLDSTLNIWDALSLKWIHTFKGIT